MNLNVTGFQPAINELDEPIPPFGAVQIVGVKLNDATGLTSLRVQTPDVGLTRVDPLRPNPELIGLNGALPMKKNGDRGSVTFADVAVAQVYTNAKGQPPITSGTLVYAQTGEKILRPPELVVSGGQRVQEFNRRVLGVFRVVAPLPDQAVISGKSAFLVHRIPQLIRLVQAVDDVAEGESGVFRCHSISGVPGNSDITFRAGDENETGVYVRAYNRIGVIEADQWRYVTFIDGVLSVVAGSAGECVCPEVWVFSSHGAITGGTADYELTLLDSGGVEVTEVITIEHADTASAIQSAIEAHSAYGLGDSPTIEEVLYGPINRREVHIRWTGAIEPPVIDSSSLDGDDGCAIRSGSFRAGES